MELPLATSFKRRIQIIWLFEAFFTHSFYGTALFREDQLEKSIFSKYFLGLYSFFLKILGQN